MATRSAISNRPSRPTSPPAKRKGIPLSPLAQRMLHDMHLAGLSDSTHESYLGAVRKFAQWLHKSPDLASENDLGSSRLGFTGVLHTWGRSVTFHPHVPSSRGERSAKTDRNGSPAAPSSSSR